MLKEWPQDDGQDADGRPEQNAVGASMARVIQHLTGGQEQQQRNMQLFSRV